jgi:hypothetical protein
MSLQCCYSMVGVKSLVGLIQRAESTCLRVSLLQRTNGSRGLRARIRCDNGDWDVRLTLLVRRSCDRGEDSLVETLPWRAEGHTG